MTDKQQPEEGSPATMQAAGPMSRRTLLRGAAPAIVTLYSGAALAKSSNLISATPNATPEDSKYRCLDTASVFSTGQANQYDLGANPMAHVTEIRSTKDYYPTTGYSGYPSGPEVTAKQMCTTGGQYVRKDTWGYQRVNVSRGVLVSATAIHSFADKVTYTDI